jgi:site-specific DNA-methyltransferase (adenine-specific)
MIELNKIYNEDCLEGMKRIPDKSIDMILCDLPYGTTACKWDTIIPFEPLWEQYNRVIKDNGAIVLTATEPFASTLRMKNLNMYKHEWIWNKENAGNFINAKNHPLRVHENVLVFSNGKVNYYPIMTDADPKNIRPLGVKKQKTDFMGKVSGGEFKPAKKYNPKKRYPKTILTYNARAKECNNVNRVHPTQKPVDLFEYLIKTYTNEGETVLDNCMGSGTTAIACINTNRNYIGFELDKHYCDIANERIQKALAEKAVSE